MIDKRFWSGAIAVVTLIVAGAGALPELLLRPASTGPAVVLPFAPKTEPIAKPDQPAAIVGSVPVPPIDRAETIAPAKPSAAEAAPHPVATAPEPPKPEPEVVAAPASAPPVAFPPVQPVGVAAAKAPEAIPPARPEGTPEAPARPVTGKPAKPDRTAQRPAKPQQNARPAVYPIGEFLLSRR